jgi:hypothetical protein
VAIGASMWYKDGRVTKEQAYARTLVCLLVCVQRCAARGMLLATFGVTPRTPYVLYHTQVGGWLVTIVSHQTGSERAANVPACELARCLPGNDHHTQHEKASTLQRNNTPTPKRSNDNPKAKKQQPTIGPKRTPNALSFLAVVAARARPVDAQVAHEVVAGQLILVDHQLQLGNDQVRCLHLVVVAPSAARLRPVWAVERVNVLLEEKKEELAVDVGGVHVDGTAPVEGGRERVDVVPAIASKAGRHAGTYQECRHTERKAGRQACMQAEAGTGRQAGGQAASRHT